MKHHNKESEPEDSPVHRIADQIHRWTKRNMRKVNDEMIRGAASRLGSGAVSLVIIWFQTRHW
ncbi:hypothetical protein ACFC8N_43030 [Streptomyces sp. NPDC055966]|uniref:hypothetical protein n=1 Tax=Streptomyces sp. NPDC055966 TaxID=3345669 RepID=UPI0035DC6002